MTTTQVLPTAEIYHSLNFQVQELNKLLIEWSKKYGCTAEFVWGFGPDGIRQLAISKIDFAVFRQPPPTAQYMEGRIEKKV